MRKGNKADFLAAMRTSLGSSWTEVEKPPLSNMSVALIVDAMTFIQRHQHLGSSTFHALQAAYLKQLPTSVPDNCHCIHFVGDCYDVSPTESLKCEEREKRMNCSSKYNEYIPHDSLAIPEWKGFIQNPQNKANLIDYVGEAWGC